MNKRLLVNKSIKKEKIVYKNTMGSSHVITHYNLPTSRGDVVYDLEINDSSNFSKKRIRVSSFLQSKYFEELLKRLGTK